jgi:hypothetical protein
VASGLQTVEFCNGVTVWTYFYSIKIENISYNLLPVNAVKGLARFFGEYFHIY